MTSFSTYASRFLSSQHPPPPAPLPSTLTSAAVDSPFSDQPHDLFDYDHDEQSPRIGGNESLHHAPRQLKGARKVGGPAGASHATAGASAASLRDMDDEDDDADEEDRDYYRDERSRFLGRGGESSAALSESTSSRPQDPFLREPDVERRLATGSNARTAAAKSRGWMAVQDSAASISASARHGRSHFNADDVYRESGDEGDEEDSNASRRYPAFAAHRDDSDSGSSQGTRSDDDDEGLLHSMQASDSPDVPGGYQGRRTRVVAADIYSYPHPPARSGWTPFAPGNSLSWREYRDKAGLAAWVVVTAGTLVVAGWSAVGARSVGRPSSPSVRPSPYYTITRSVPILFLLTLLSVSAAAAHMLLLRHFSRLGGPQVLKSALIGVPVVLGLGWAWAFGGSFIYDDEEWSGGGWSTTGLRILSLIPLAAAGLFARAVWARRGCLSRSLGVLELSARITAAHPALLVLTLAQLGVFLVVTIPFLSVFARLFLLGHFGRPGQNDAEGIWHTDARAKWLAWATLGAWLWTWATLSGIQRVTVAGVVSHWYFHGEQRDKGRDEAAAGTDSYGEDSLPGPSAGNWLVNDDDEALQRAPSQSDIVRAAFGRATGSALGTVCVAALVLSLARMGGIIASVARRTNAALSSRRTPTWLQPLAYVAALLAATSVVLKGLSDYALVYVGVTGESFAAAARRSSRLVRRNGVGNVMEGLIVHLVLDLTTLALSFLAGLAGFLFSAHNLHVPADAPLVGLLCALVPYWTLKLCTDVLRNAADTLFLCYAIDEAGGEEHCKEAVEVFTSEDKGLPF